MKENIKQIVADFIKIPADQINEATEIGRAALVNSILVHRMYAAIAKEGAMIDNYWEIKTYGDLLNKISGNTLSENSFSIVSVSSNPLQIPDQTHGIGIDMEEISNLPRTNDFREDEFYKMNFTHQEIAYCGLQPDPYASFAGLFAVKEAIVKANNFYRSVPFYKISVNHLPDGQPVIDGFRISISHTKILAIAVALKEPETAFFPSPSHSTDNYPVQSRQPFPFLSLLAIILAAAALLLIFFR
jgi:phosphopantetheinyl transferase (holo-ACP synthase)